MITRYRAWKNEIGLQDIHDSIFITDIKEKTPKITAVTAAKPMGGGLHVQRMRRDSLSVVIRLAIRDYSTASRKATMSRVAAWAMEEGYLAIADRPGQRLYVRCEKPPVVESALKWTAETEMTLTAYDSPWWEDDTPTTVSGSGTSFTATLPNPGDVESLVDATIKPSGKLTTFTITANGSTMTFSGLSVASGSTVEITHTPAGLLCVKSGSNSLLAYRTAASADDLTAAAGLNAITFSANTSCAVTFATRGRYY